MQSETTTPTSDPETGMAEVETEAPAAESEQVESVTKDDEIRALQQRIDRLEAAEGKQTQEAAVRETDARAEETTGERMSAEDRKEIARMVAGEMRRGEEAATPARPPPRPPDVPPKSTHFTERRMFGRGKG